MKKILLMWPPGAAGTFLANWLTPDDDYLPEPKYKLDESINKNIYRKGIYVEEFYQLGLKMINGSILDLSAIDKQSFAWSRFLEEINIAKTGPATIYVSHIIDERSLLSFVDVDISITIWPINNRFGYYRAHLTKDFQYADVDDFSSYMGWLKVIQNEFDNFSLPDRLGMIVDYADLFDINYLMNLHRKIYDDNLPSLNKIKWAEKYLAMQGKPIINTTHVNFKKLREEIQPKKLIDLAILLHIYEMNNPKLKRRWSINDVPFDFDAASNFLYENHNNYY